MESVKHRTVTANGIRQHYIDAGQGPAVVLLHGFPFTNYTWRDQIPELSKKYRVIAPDLRGYGETDKPVTGYDKRNMAKDLRELMRALKIDKIALVGHDRGGVWLPGLQKIIPTPSIVSSSSTTCRRGLSQEISIFRRWPRPIGCFCFI